MQFFFYYDETETPISIALYFLKLLFAFLTIPELLLVLYCYQRFPDIRNRRFFFTLYVTGIDCIGRMIFFCYYAIRLSAIYVDANVTARLNCSLFTGFVFFAQALTLTAFIHLHFHACIAVVAPNFYLRVMKTWICVALAVLFHAVDVTIAVVSQQELERRQYANTYDFLQRGISHCQFEKISRFSIIYSFYLLIELCLFGLAFLFEVIASRVNRCRAKHFDNPVANSPFSHWAQMSPGERIASVTITTLSVAVTLAYVAGEIVFLLHGNTIAKQILSLNVSAFAVLAPIQIMWLNQDMRKAVCAVLGSTRCGRHLRCLGAQQTLDEEQAPYALAAICSNQQQRNGCQESEKLVKLRNYGTSSNNSVNGGSCSFTSLSSSDLSQKQT